MTWAEVVQSMSDRRDPMGDIDKLMRYWGRLYGVCATIDETCPILRVTWTAAQSNFALLAISRVHPRIFTTEKPRRMDGPQIMVDMLGNGLAHLDGRRRANLRIARGLDSDVIIIRAKPCES